MAHQKTTYINFPPEEAVVQILEALAPYAPEQRELILAVVASNPQYPQRPTINGTHDGAFAAIRAVKRPGKAGEEVADFVARMNALGFTITRRVSGGAAAEHQWEDFAPDSEKGGAQ